MELKNGKVIELIEQEVDIDELKSLLTNIRNELERLTKEEERLKARISQFNLIKGAK